MEQKFSAKYNTFLNVKTANWLFIAIFLTLSSYPLLAEDEHISLEDTFHQWNSSLSFTEETLALEPESKSKLHSLLENLKSIKKSATELSNRSRSRLESERYLLESLGLKPEPSAPPEAKEVIEQRATFSRNITLYDGQYKRSNLVIARANSSIEKIASIKFKELSNAFYEKSPFPFSSNRLAQALKQLSARSEELENRRVFWLTQMKSRQLKFAGTGKTLVVLVCLVVLGILLTRWLRRNFGWKSQLSDPTTYQKINAALSEAVSRIVIPISVVTLFTWFVFYTYGIEGGLKSFLISIVLAAIQFIVIVGLSKVLLADDYSHYRINTISNQSAVGLFKSLLLFAFTSLIISFLTIIYVDRSDDALEVLNISSSNLPQELATMIAASSVYILALLMLNVLRSKNWQFIDFDKNSDIKKTPLTYKLIINFARVALVACSLLALLGYMNLALFILIRTSWIFALLIAAKLSHELIVTLITETFSNKNLFGNWLRNSLHTSDDGKKDAFWMVLVFEICLIIAIFPIILLLLGVPWDELSPILSDLMFGAKIGSFSFSLIDMGVAFGILFLILICTRFFQKLLSNHILVQTSFDIGVRDAITAGFGYVGIVVAVLVALSMLGLEMSEVAIVFGALSVGIGFGLQHVANNFVSGLVLLIQRPIKAGDWVVVGNNEGYVKRVNVITTEIQTFDNASLIVPNSDLVSSQVLNWMHKNKLGRVIIPIGVSYDSNPEQVKKILLKCAENNPIILKRPAPNVIFKDFGDSALIFELRFFIRDMEDYWQASSDSRFAIKTAFQNADIVIPFPQRDMHLKSKIMSKTNDCLSDDSSSPTEEYNN